MTRQVTFLILLLLLAACSKKKSGSGSNPAPAPTAAALLLPANNQTCTTGQIISATQSSVSFSWGSAQNTDEYELTVINLLTQIKTEQSVQGTQISVNLLQNTPYSWYVTSKSQKNTTAVKSGTWKFYNAGAGIVTYAPFPAEIIAPLLGQLVTSVNGKVNLTWTGNSVNGNITGYNVYFGPSNNPSLFRSQITDNFVNDVSVNSNITYYWRVVTIDSNGNISDSGMYNFYVVK